MTTPDAPTKEDIDRAFGHELALARRERGLSHQQLAERVELDADALAAIEDGTVSAGLREFFELCLALNLRPDDLCGKALQRGGLFLSKATLHVDLAALRADKAPLFEWAPDWAQDEEGQNRERVIELKPAEVEEIAEHRGCDPSELARYLARFLPRDRLQFKPSPDRATSQTRSTSTGS